jgi:hypothetical protein
MIEHGGTHAGQRPVRRRLQPDALHSLPRHTPNALGGPLARRMVAGAGFAVALASLSQAAYAADGTTGGCAGTGGEQVSPYKDYSCLDAYLGEDFGTRFLNYYKLEMGQAGPPSDPNAPSSHREGWPATPETTPPISFTEWPYGVTTPLGVTRPSSIDSPFMAAISNTSVGSWMEDNHIQVYGWVNFGGNVSSNTTRPGGNAPIAYQYTPNTVQLDQLVFYAERLPDTVQTDHIDWGFRLSALYGENYRYTTSYGLASYQLLKDNKVNGYDFPMLYGEVYVPQIADGLNIRVGRYISIPDIEAQLAPNNYMYSHSMTYSFDNYTNEGVLASLAVAKNLIVQVGVSMGTEATLWHYDQTVHNPDPNPLFPGSTFKKDPGAQPSLAACIRYTWNDGDDTIYPCMDGINNATWGYNNLNWYGFTYYHKFNDKWHLSFEAYDLWQNDVPNLNNPTATAAVANGGTPFSPQSIPFNAPDLANCHNAAVLSCRAEAIGTVAYLNYTVTPLDNISFRPEYFQDREGQRTGTRANYLNFGLGWQHWLSPQFEFRPEIDWDRSLGAKAFNGNSNAGIAPNKNYTVMVAADAILHF